VAGGLKVITLYMYKGNWLTTNICFGEIMESIFYSLFCNAWKRNLDTRSSYFPYI